MGYRSNYRRTYRQQPASRFFSGLVRFTLFAILVIAALSGGLWLLALALGLAVGFVSLLISLAPILIVAWLVWLVMKAVLV